MATPKSPRKIAIVTSPDCGNSPKNQFVQGLAIAMATGDHPTLLAALTDDVQWRVAGSDAIEGCERVIDALARVLPPGIRKVKIHHALSHGSSGAVNGTLETSRADGVEFCHVVEFASAKANRVRGITSYLAQT